MALGRCLSHNPKQEYNFPLNRLPMFGLAQVFLDQI